jgi:hypothetical protein
MLKCENDDCPFLRANEKRFRARCCTEDCPYCGQEMVRTDIKP